jgi:cyanophycin synthetase
VVGNKLVAAARGETASVVGDGKSSIVELIDSQINSDPRCGEDESSPLEPVCVEREPAVLLELSARASRPTRCRLRQESADQRNGNLADDVTDEVHPEVAEAATLAAAWSASTSPASTSSPRTSRARWKHSAAPSSR